MIIEFVCTPADGEDAGKVHAISKINLWGEPYDGPEWHVESSAGDAPLTARDWERVYRLSHGFDTMDASAEAQEREFKERRGLAPPPPVRKVYPGAGR